MKIGGCKNKGKVLLRVYIAQIWFLALSSPTGRVEEKGKEKEKGKGTGMEKGKEEREGEGKVEGR